MVGSLAVSSTLYMLEPPLGVVIGVILCGLLVGALTGKPRVAFASGLIAGLAGFLIAYILGGGGLLGLTVYRELLGPLGPLAPIAYYMIACSFTSTLTAMITQALRITSR